MIVIIDYGMGNLGSIHNMLNKVEAQSIITSDLDQINNADKIILPGVGSFDEGMKNIRKLGFESIIYEKVRNGNTPVLGICLGMQLLLGSSEEGNQSGLSLIAGYVKKFEYNQHSLRIPHMGWNELTITQPENQLVIDLPPEQRFYFVHSYYVVCENSEDILFRTNYGVEFTSGLNRDNLWGVQFHPEKSHKFGMKILENFNRI